MRPFMPSARLPYLVRSRPVAATELLAGLGSPEEFSIDELDPGQPRPVHPRDAAVGREAQRRRRAQILACARALIAKGGVEGLTLRHLAAISGLSVQTVYNLIGNRTDVIEAAISDHIEAVAQNLRTSLYYPDMFLALSDAIWMNIVTHQAYARNATLACQATDLYVRIQSRQALVLHRALDRRFRSRAVAARLDLSILARHTTAMVGVTAIEWARNIMDLPTLRYRLATTYGMMLTSLLPAEELVVMNDWLDGLRPRTAQFRLE